MKKFLPFFLGLFCAISAIGQNQVLKNPEPPSYKKCVDPIMNSSPYDELKLDSVIIESWNSTDSIYTNSNRDIYQYSNGKEVRYTHFNWDNNTGEWALSFKNEYSYDANGYQILNIGSIWDASALKWNYGSKNEMYKNQNGKDTLSYSYIWNSTLGDWIPGMRYLYYYNEAGTQTYFLLCQWNAGNSAWDSVYKSDFYQDKSGVDSLEIWSFWDAGSGKWNVSGKAKSFKNESGLDTLTYQYHWSPESSEWIVSQKSVDEYNNNGEDSVTSIYSWNSSENQWQGLIRYEMTYGTDKSFVNQYSGQDGQWVFTSRVISYYSGYTVTGIKNPATFEISVYPNPAREFIMIDLNDNSNSATIEIYNIQGKKVLYQRITGKEPINISDLPKGIYLYKIVNQGIHSTGKFQVE